MVDEKQGRVLQTYDQPTKRDARTLSLTHAVELLTTRRDDVAIVPADYVERVRTALLASEVPGDVEAARACDDVDVASWRALRADSIGTRRADELTVAYLAGPQPSNDLLALLGLGLRPENIWAFEVDPHAIVAGVEDLRALGLRGVKFVPASLDEYMIGTPRRFDIIYVDACGPLPSDKQKTTRLLVDVFRHSALAPLGVLVTNFACPDVSKAEVLDEYSFLVASYLYPKDFLESDGHMIEGASCHGFLFKNPDEVEKCFLTKVADEFQEHYGSFITRQVMDIAEIIAPTMRLTSSRLYELLFDRDLDKAAARARRFVKFNAEAFEGDDEAGSPDIDMDGDAIVDSSFFTLVWTMAALGFYEAGEDFHEAPRSVKKFAASWKNQLRGSPAGAGARPVEDLVAAFYAWRHDRTLWSPAMKAVGSFPYRTMPFLCDVPTDELAFYPTFAQLAYPAHPNVRDAKRWRYVAEGKSTTMFLDVIAFDECRYVYDWISAMHLVTNDWVDLSAQLTFRFALDAIVKERRWIGSDFLVGCHSVGECADFRTSHLSARIDLSAEADG